MDAPDAKGIKWFMASFAQVGGVEAVPAVRGFLVREHRNSGVVERVVLWVSLVTFPSREGSTSRVA